MNRTPVADSRALPVSAGAADFPGDYSKYLVPLVVDVPIPGALGSLWVTRLALSNEAETPASVLGFDAVPGGCGLPGCPSPEPLPGNTTIFPTVERLTSAPGAFLYVEKGREADVTMHLRAQDLSRQPQTWGTSIPVVGEGDLLSGSQTINLVDVPVGAEFRSLLRLYDFVPNTTRTVLVKVYAISELHKTSQGVPPDELLGELSLTFRRDAGTDENHGPGYVELLLVGHPMLSGRERVRLEVSSNSPDLRFWGFVSATNNETQHITIIAPE